MANEDKSTKYHRLRRRADLLGTAIAGVVLLALSFSGSARAMRDAVGGGDGALTVALLTLVLILLLQAIEFPFALYQGHILEHRYGLSTQSLGRWLTDHFKGVGLGAGLGIVAVSLVFGAMRMAPEQWWWMSALVFGMATIGMAHIAPVVLLPIFYTFKPLDRPELVDRLMRLATRARTDVMGVFEWGLSSHTKRANAALAGMGKTRRILLSDTLLADYSEDEIEVILAHELAHHVHKDLWRGILVQAAILVAGFYVADGLARAALPVVGLQRISDPALLPLLMVIGGAWSFLAMPLANAVSRAQERAADRYALTTTRNVDAFVTAMKRLSQQNLAEEYPSPVIRWLFFSHPPIRERIDAARAFARESRSVA